MTTEPLDLDRLVDEAGRSTGLSDLGEPSWREGAERLVDGLTHDAQLHEEGSFIASTEITNRLANRMQIVDWVGRHPEIAQRDIRPPIVVLGHPRTGTTILYELLAQDPANRVPLTWEVELPWPPPRAETYDSDPRIADVQAGFEAAEIQMPGFSAIHEMGARMGQECSRIIAGEFRTTSFAVQYRVPSYKDWVFHEADMGPAYRYHRLFLQYLDSGFPAERWVLKSPSHLWSLGPLLQEYPDALIIHTHRDPLPRGVLAGLAHRPPPSTFQR